MFGEDEELARRLRCLRDVPIIDYALNQRSSSLASRAIDSRWFYKGIIPTPGLGFNPFSGRAFYGTLSLAGLTINNARSTLEASAVIDWARTEWLIYEVLCVTHDSLHVWAVQRGLSYLNGVIHSNLADCETICLNIEFLTIFSEVVATVGLDFWYLCRHQVFKQRGILTKYTGLTTRYRDWLVSSDERQVVQQQSFFYMLLQAYISGEFNNIVELTRSTASSDWISREIKQSRSIRTPARAWTNYVFGSSTNADACRTRLSDLLAEYKELVSTTCSDLWNTTKSGDFSLMGAADLSYALPGDQVVDFRFFNIRRHENWRMLDFDIDLSVLPARQFGYLAAQFVFSFRCERDEGLSAEKFDAIILSRDVGCLLDWSKGKTVVSVEDIAPGHLIFPN